MARKRRKKKNPETGWRSYGMGKFDSMVDSFLHADGNVDEETGESDGPGWYGLLVGDILETAERGAEMMNDTLTEGEREELKGTAAVILSEDSQGFVSSRYFDTAAEARKVWKQVEKEVAGFYEDEEGGEE